MSERLTLAEADRRQCDVLLIALNDVETLRADYAVNDSPIILREKCKDLPVKDK